nr:hypothetical protein TetV2_00308 [Oceanusvirus sp.]
MVLSLVFDVARKIASGVRAFPRAPVVEGTDTLITELHERDGGDDYVLLSVML